MRCSLTVSVVHAPVSVRPGWKSFPPDRSEIYGTDLGTRSRPRCSRHSVNDLRGVSRGSTTEDTEHPRRVVAEVPWVTVQAFQD